MTHILEGHNVLGETRRASLQKPFPPWTVTREQYTESLSAQRSGISNAVLLFSEVGLTLVHHYRVHSVGRPHAMFRGKYLTQLRSLLLTIMTTPTSERPLSNDGPWVAAMSGRTDDSCARPRPPGRRRRSQGRIQNTATQVAPRLTEQDPRMAAGAVVFDCRPAVLPVSVDVSAIDMRTVRHAKPPTEPVVAPTEREQEFGGPILFDHINPELEVIPLLESGTDYQDELSSPDGSLMVISPIVGLSPSQGEDDVDLAQILAEFGTLPAFVTPSIDHYAEGEMPHGISSAGGPY